jgi:hypothetical protein
VGDDTDAIAIDCRAQIIAVVCARAASEDDSVVAASFAEPRRQPLFSATSPAATNSFAFGHFFW